MQNDKNIIYIVIRRKQENNLTLEYIFSYYNEKIFSNKK